MQLTKKHNGFVFLNKTNKYPVHAEIDSKNLASGSSTGYKVLCFIVHYALREVEPMAKLISVGDEKSGSEEA